MNFRKDPWRLYQAFHEPRGVGQKIQVPLQATTRADMLRFCKQFQKQKRTTVYDGSRLKKSADFPGTPVGHALTRLGPKFQLSL